ncbi:MAG: RHS repeat-associated core domain-containing protein [Bryobacteraceae bacterium]|nr:RHS repeat-associated core domain-containing protein [Bryobacteraceae bacterium]
MMDQERVKIFKKSTPGRVRLSNYASSVATSDGIAQSFTYRPSGRIDTSTQTVGGVPYSFAYTYYKDGSLKSVTYPSGRLIEYPSLDRAGRVLKVQGTLAGTTTEYAKAVTYNASGQMSSLTFGNDLIERWDYNPRRLQPWQIRLGTATVDDARGRWQFGYCAGLNYNQDCASNNGNVMHQRILPLNLYQTYAYDTLNRLSLFEEKATSAAPACAAGGSTPCRAYGYDNWSNQFVSQANAVTRHSFTPAAASNFDAANRLIIQGSTYDPAGNQTGIGGYTFAYDAENRLKTSTINSVTTTFEYDGEGRRVKKGNETYVYDAFGNLAAEYGGTPTPVGTQYLTTDHLGSTRLITKADGTVDRRIDYLPFGKAIPNGVSGRATGQGYQTNNYLDPLKPGFTGKDRDGETGLDYFGARYMSAAQGRFTSADPFNPVDELDGAAFDDYLANPQYWNKYAYSLNNPLKYKDSDGHLPHAVVGALVGGGVGGALELYSQIRSGQDMNWAKVATKTGVGAAVGATAAATFGASLVVQGLSLGVVNTAAGIADRGLDNDATTQALDQTAILTDAVVGGVAGVAGGVIGKQTQSMVQNSASQKLNERLADHGVRATAQRSASRQAAARETQQRVAQHPETVARRAAGAGRAAAKAGATAAAQRAAEALKKRKEEEDRR